MSEDIELLQEKIGYRFNGRELLLTALSHPSYSSGCNYERLEFLGDAVIELCVSRYLYEKFPDAQEGKLTRKRSEIVCSSALVAIAKKIDLGSCLLLGKGEETTGGRQKKSILENAMEALVGAIYLDSDFETACTVIEKLIISSAGGDMVDYKSRLQEYVQARGQGKLHYEIYCTEGPPHDSIFYVKLLLEKEEISRGTGKSKKAAEQDAARQALNNF